MTHEESARLAKAYRIADHFERTVREVWKRVEADAEVAIEAADVVNLARLTTRDEWNALADAAGANHPSDKTVALIITILERRAEDAADPVDPFASFDRDRTSR